MHRTTGERVATEADVPRTGWRLSAGGARTRGALALLPDARVGDRLLVHAGAAFAVVRPEPGEARQRED